QAGDADALVRALTERRRVGRHCGVSREPQGEIMRLGRSACAAILLCASAWAQVPYERIVNAAKEPGNWVTYSGNYLGHRYSPLTQITPANVAGLRVKWAYQFPNRRTEVSPLVVD